MIQQAADTIASKPRTILSFLVAVFVVVVIGSFSVIAALARYDDLRYLIAWVLGFDGILTVLMLAAVFLTAWFDPMRLMLGHVTGTEFTEHRRLVMGDSSSGESKVSIPLLPVRKSEDDTAQSKEAAGE